MYIPSAIRYIIGAAAKGPTRYAINGVHLHREGTGKQERTCAVVTDGHIILRARWTEPPPAKLPPAFKDLSRHCPDYSVTIPPTAWKDAHRLAKKNHAKGLQAVLLQEEKTRGPVQASTCQPSYLPINLWTADRKGDLHKLTVTVEEKPYFHYRDVIPTYRLKTDAKGAYLPEAVRIGLSPRLLSILCTTIHRLLADAPSITCAFTVPTNPLKPVVITARACDSSYTCRSREDLLALNIDLTAVQMPCKLPTKGI